jgi:hypothetical protein
METLKSVLIGLSVGVMTVYILEPGEQALVKAYKQGRADALRTKVDGKLNWELEQTCVGLWAEGLPDKGAL